MDSDYNCWEGWQLQGKPRTVMRRGEIVIEDGRLVGSTTGGRFLERSIAPEVVSSPRETSLTARRSVGSRAT